MKKDNLYIIPVNAVNYDFCTYRTNDQLKQRLEHRYNDQHNLYELYDSVNENVIMSSSFSLEHFLRKDND